MAPPPSSVRLWIPSVVAVVLSIPSFGWPFLWDDFDFLVRAKTIHLRDLLPDSTIALYRPISRELYFSIIQHLAGASVFVAHLLNAVVAAASVYMLVLLLRRSYGERVAVIGGLIFASAAAIPFLVGWISGIQDLLCIFFALAAFHFYVRGKVALGALAFAAALLSKETAVALAPALFVLAVRPGATRNRIVGVAASLGVILGTWIAIHPWAHRVLTTHEATRVNEYVAFRGADTFFGLVRGLPSLFNLSSSHGHVFQAGVVAAAAIASILVILATRLTWTKSPGSTGSVRLVEQRQVFLAAILTTLCPFLLTGAFIGHWSPYYAGISLLGIAILVAPPLARAPWILAASALVAFLWVGVWAREAVTTPEIPAENNLRVTAAALRKVEGGFKALHGELPHGAKVYLYIMAPGTHGVYVSLYRNQPLKVWYNDPTIEVADPLRLLPRSGPEFLFWISPELEVFEVDPNTMRPRSSGSRIPLVPYQKTLRAFALGLAGRGDVDRAVSILLEMPQDVGSDLAYDRRSAAALLYAAGRAGQANQVLETTLHFHPEQARREVAGLIAKPVPGIDFDEGALRAFEIALSDTLSIRGITRWLDGRGYRESAARFARRLLMLVPGDQEALQVLVRSHVGVTSQITTPANRTP